MATKTRRLADLLANIDDNSKVTSAGLLDATITATDLAPNSVDSSELVDGAVDTSHIADSTGAADGITTAKLATNAVTSAKITDANITAAKLSSTALASVEHVKPHIQPGVLHPAWDGLLSENSGAYTFTDSGTTGHVITSGGSVHHSPKEKKTENSAITFNGIDDYISAPDHADWDFGNGSYTIEWWQNMSGDAGASTGIWAHWEASNDRFQCYKNTANKVSIYSNYGNSAGYPAAPNTELTSSVAVVFGAWEHYALVCVGDGSGGGAHKLYRNGAEVASADHTLSQTGIAGTFRIGHESQSAHEWYDGYIDGIRITKGLAVYTGAFTTPTSALTTTWAANPFGGSNTAANSTASNVKLLINSNATGVNVGAYGTAQSDGRSYYYTDIKGSKPIKDPRIGAHFGSQRHKFKSLQKLEQESATHGGPVFSIDGREWMHSVSGLMDNGAYGMGMYWESSGWGANYAGIIEIVGYFSDANILGQSRSGTGRGFTWAIDGGSATQNDGFEKGYDSPYRGKSRFVDASSVLNLGLGATLGLHTLKLSTPAATGDTPDLNGIELIAQDTTSTATKSKIQIPAQNVVSYGKKFSVSAAAHHYDPFNGFTNGTSLHSAFVDTATSLGLDSAPGFSAKWAISNSNNIRPYNGGRVVKWIASDGTIKTSVTMMPPNAQNVKTTASNEIATPSATNTTTTPNMSDDAIDHSLSEVAKTFIWNEFGNGKANNSSDSVLRDASMLTTSTEDIAYVMDDGLTSLIGNDVNMEAQNFMCEATDDFWGATFIGTGVSISTIGGSTYAEGTHHIANNLPYGTHILKTTRTSSAGSEAPTMHLDGLTYTHGGTHSGRTYGGMYDITYHQPKKPPIPDDACIIADYMLMADFVRQAAPTVTSAPWDPDHTLISKGVRMCSPSRDVMWQETTGGYVFSFDVLNTGPGGFYLASSSTSSGGQNNYAELPAFGTDFLLANNAGGGIDLYVNGTDVAHTTTTGHNMNDLSYPDSATTLGNNIFKGQGLASDYSPYITAKGFMIVSPIHTSSHYQEFETPYLKELVGGDRNMEQTNLVVTADGKTWDEVTRDTSYIDPNMCVSTSTDTASTSPSQTQVFDDWRGVQRTYKHRFNKDFAIGAGKLICLVDGMYQAQAQTIRNATNTTACEIRVNGTAQIRSHSGTSNHDTPSTHIIVHLKRGDYVECLGQWYGGELYSHFQIRRIG